MEVSQVLVEIALVGPDVLAVIAHQTFDLHGLGDWDCIVWLLL